MPLLLTCALSLAAFCAPAKKAPPSKPFRYVLGSKVISKKDASQLAVSHVSLLDTRTGRILWKRDIVGYNPNWVVWAKDHRALLLDSNGEFLIWRIGHPLLKTPYAGVLRPEGIDRYDYLMGAKWSPDASRLLLSFGMSGMADMGYSRLFCMTLRGNRYNYTVLPVDSYVRDMGWRSNRVAVYYPAVGVGLQSTGKPRLWRIS